MSCRAVSCRVRQCRCRVLGSCSGPVRVVLCRLGSVLCLYESNWIGIGLGWIGQVSDRIGFVGIRPVPLPFVSLRLDRTFIMFSGRVFVMFSCVFIRRSA